ncbi:hypothetical protein J7J74_01685 [bacterium]|nr:hypothetical protein [bacterium]
MNILPNFFLKVKDKKEELLRLAIVFLSFLLAFGLGFLISKIIDHQELKFEYESSPTSWNYY